MLQQIIREMYIEPDLLAELSDEQKQLIYIKIREEQVRRWKEVEDKCETKEKISTSKKAGKTVQFLLAKDQNPWVWVMGDHPDDKSIDEMLEEEVTAKAICKAEKEASLLREKEEKEADKALREEERRMEADRLEQERRLVAIAAAQRKQVEDAQRLAQTQREAAKAKQEIEKLKERSEKARLTREESYRVLKEKRTSEIVSAFHKTKALWEQKASVDGRKLDKAWQQQEKKAKQAETSQRRLVRGAREDYRRNSLLQKDSGVTIRAHGMSKEVFRESAVLLNNVLRAVDSSHRQPHKEHRPSSKLEIEKWFVEEEKPRKSGIDKSGAVEPWFHGIISREEAEILLSEKPVHSFLVRVSEKIWGYAISYKSEDRCKHYLIDTTENGYQFFGTNQLEHPSLSQLVHHHKNHPVSTAGQELLLYAVGQSQAPPDYHQLFPELLESTSL